MSLRGGLFRSLKPRFVGTNRPLDEAQALVFLRFLRLLTCINHLLGILTLMLTNLILSGLGTHTPRTAVPGLCFRGPELCSEVRNCGQIVNTEIPTLHLV